MSKVAIVYWSGTGNTEAMANYVAEGVKKRAARLIYLLPQSLALTKLASMTESHLAARPWELNS